MSWTEINHSKGIRSGGMPYDRILEKLEETDPALVDDVRGYDMFHDIEDEYKNYVTDEIIDWTPDAPYLESDQTRRDPALSRGILNLHLNGTRGSRPELPRHPELFYGFTGNDPRGAVNDPRFDQVRGHITGRVGDLTVRMQDSDSNHIAESPWTNQAISYGKKEIQRRLKNSTRVFTPQKEGRPWGRNVVLDDLAPKRTRQEQFAVGSDGLADGASGALETEDPAAAPARFFAGDHGPASDAITGGIRGVDHSFREGAERAPWRNTVEDRELPVQHYGQQRGAGRSSLGDGAVGGARATVVATEQDFGMSRANPKGANRRVLGATMGAAARYSKAVRAAQPDAEYGYTHLNLPLGRSAPSLSRDVAAAYRQQTLDGARRPQGTVQDGDGGHLGAAAGLAPAAHPEHAIRRAETTHPDAAAHLTNVDAIVRGLREGTAAGRRKIAGAVIASGARGNPVNEETPGVRGLGLPSAEMSQAAKLTEMPLERAAAAGREVQQYGHAVPSRPEQRAANARVAFDPATWHGQREALPLGRSKRPGEFRSHTQMPATTGADAAQTFGFDAPVRPTGAPVGPKTLRAGDWSDGVGLSDELRSDWA